jgi:hypothetical protein
MRDGMLVRERDMFEASCIAARRAAALAGI